MRKGIWILLSAMLAFVSCSDDYMLGIIARKDTLGQSQHREPSGPAAESPDTVIYICAVEFPEGYNWQRDTAYGIVESNLAVYRNGTKTITVPVGGKNLVSSDPDMHRVVNGHLYTDYVIGNQTIIKKDGREVFRYSGGESLCGFIVRDDGIWTLGQSRSGQGLTLRKNGKEIFSSATGFINGTFANQAFRGGALYEDSGSLYFSYYVPNADVLTGEIVSRAWYIVKDGVPKGVTPPSGLSVTHDIRMIGGKLCIAGEAAGEQGRTVLIEGQEQYKFGSASSWKRIRNCRLASSSRGPCIKEEESFDVGSTYISVLLQKDGTRSSTTWPLIAKEFYISGDVCAFVNTNNSDSSIESISIDGRQHLLPGRMRMMTNACATLIGQRLIVAMSPYTSEETPVIWDNGERSQLPINGYVTSVTYTAGE